MIENPNPVEGQFQSKRLIIHDRRPVDRDLVASACARKAPWYDLPAREAKANAIVAAQVLWRLRRAMRFQVLARSCHGPTEILTDAHGDHVALDPPSCADAGIE